ncbi:MAG: Rrf2 family transcriptional regulator [Oscillospiraceae bacterium]|nr:Rrf2 family transcriptional regulator [Oscillospiraceae bacterium]
MKFTAKAEYGLAALADIAIHSEQGEKTTTVEIAQRQNISHKYLEQILLQLRQANLIRASKGQKGGYSLMRPASGIHISDVLNALDSSILADAAEIGSESGLRRNIKDCLWDKMNGAMRACTDRMTLAELIEQGICADDSGNYVI